MIYFKVIVLNLALFVIWPYVLSQDTDILVIQGIQGRVSLENYLEKVSLHSGYSFFYDESLLKDIFLDDRNNGTALFDYFRKDLGNKGISYIQYKEVNIILVDRNKMIFKTGIDLSDGRSSIDYNSVVDIGDPMLAGKYKSAKISGLVRNGKTGEPLPGAVIYVPDRDLGTITDPVGHFVIELSTGRHELQCSFVGFENQNVMINLISPGTIDIELFEETFAIDQVVITSNSDANVTSAEMSIIRLDAKTINNIPVLMGEPDLIKTMTLMPGVQSAGDMASGFNVRGGSTDQNLILLDDVPVYNPSHLFGMFSVIDTRIIDNLELYKGGAPARFGGRIASVMDISLKEGNFKKFQANGSLGLFSSKLTVQGPVVKDKASFIIGGRTTYSDWILKRIPDADIRHSSANFYDVNFKFNYILNQKNRISIFSYLSKDKLDLSDINKYEYGNKLSSLKWSNIINDNFTFSLSLYYSDYQSVSIDNENKFNASLIKTGISQAGSKLKFLYTIHSRHSLEVGFEGNQYKFLSGARDPFGSESLIIAQEIENEQSYDIAGYVQDVIELGKFISVTAGLRYSRYFIVGPASVYQYNSSAYINDTTVTGSKEYSSGDIIKNFGGLEPRVGIRGKINAMSSVKLGYSRSIQYLHMVSNSTVITPTDIWKSSDPYITPANSDQVTFGFFRNFRNGLIETSFEVYYKKVNNVLEYKNNARLIMNDAIERDLLEADMNAYGLEILLSKNSGRLTGWISYTFSRSFLKTIGSVKEQMINNGEEYPSYYDKPHDLSLVLNYKISRRFTFGSSFVYSTGRPTTYPEIIYSVHSNTFIHYSDRNEYRLRDYHRMDLSLTWDTSLRKSRKFYSSWTLSVYNAYGRKNVYSTFYKKDVPSEANDYKAFALYEMSIIGVPIPSLTYNLRF